MIDDVVIIIVNGTELWVVEEATEPTLPNLTRDDGLTTTSTEHRRRTETIRWAWGQGLERVGDGRSAGHDTKGRGKDRMWNGYTGSRVRI